MNDARTYCGGCLCGSVRYRVAGPPIDAGYCHCRMCQQAHAAPVVAWATFPYDAFALTSGELVHYASSAAAERRFCGRCGTQIAFCKRRDPQQIDIAVAGLDEPALLPPEYHIWTASQISWLNILDSLPRHAGGGPHPTT